MKKFVITALLVLFTLNIAAQTRSAFYDVVLIKNVGEKESSHYPNYTATIVVGLKGSADIKITVGDIVDEHFKTVSFKEFGKGTKDSRVRILLESVEDGGEDPLRLTMTLFDYGAVIKDTKGTTIYLID